MANILSKKEINLKISLLEKNNIEIEQTIERLEKSIKTLKDVKRDNDFKIKAYSAVLNKKVNKKSRTYGKNVSLLVDILKNNPVDSWDSFFVEV